mmetsp:Transcript_19277/g.62881  ORF Transcript_19277/g.62881 Transcript_19277/m.62881 type:complete len:282 (-) Transcript_19277:2814-3659(-)
MHRPQPPAPRRPHVLGSRVRLHAEPALLAQQEQRRQVDQHHPEVDQDQRAPTESELEHGRDGRDAVDEDGEGGGQISGQQGRQRLPHRPLEPLGRAEWLAMRSEHLRLGPRRRQHEDAIGREAQHDPQRAGCDCRQLLLAAQHTHQPVHDGQAEGHLDGRDGRNAPAAKEGAEAHTDEAEGDEKQPHVVREGGEQLAEQQRGRAAVVHLHARRRAGHVRQQSREPCPVRGAHAAEPERRAQRRQPSVLWGPLAHPMLVKQRAREEAIVPTAHQPAHHLDGV